MTLVGQSAPDFSADAYFNGEFIKVESKEQLGKWVVLLFYPLDFTFVCPTEILAFSKAAKDFTDRNCALFGVSVDSKFVHKSWVEAARGDGGLDGCNFPLISDLDKSITAAYGVPAGPVALRGLFLIDPEGNVQHATINNLPVGRSTSEALRVLEAFQYVSSHSGEVCPANWKAGEDTMQASPEGMHSFLSKLG